MLTSSCQLLGGIGLFLLGMTLLTDGLKAFAGEALRRALVRFTGTPFKAFCSGAVITVLVQSSSATTVTVIGFVSAGLLTFPQAIGVVLGASLGTTGTGWLVSVLGLKVSLGVWALPLVGVGTFIKLLAPGRWRSLGLALAGFGLVFIGIETLQLAMRGFSQVLHLARLPAGGLWGHGVAMGLGILLTVVMQSSSAAVATTLTALQSGAVNFEQAASLVIGAAVGTTVTGVLAAIGGGVPAKRTALAHVVFNLASGLIALVLLPVFLWGIRQAQEHAGLDPGAVSLAAFHTGFIALGVLIFLPFAERGARIIEQWLPDRGPVLTRHLDSTVLKTPAVALEATRRALSETAAESFDAARSVLENPMHAVSTARLALPRAALARLQEFFPQIPAVAEDDRVTRRRLAQLHALDHLARFQARWTPPGGIGTRIRDPRLQGAVRLTATLLELGASGLRHGGPESWEVTVASKAADLAELRRLDRPLILRETATGRSDPSTALELLDVIRWLDRLGYHAWRITHHLAHEDPSAQTLAEPDPFPDEP
ncbi:MAG: Na/Pi cotransporter family protein [Verrucomicrobiae bacterium]|nr:Na/Pi cotransporter family protein [Verrucomicrobiae bacterium]